MRRAPDLIRIAGLLGGLLCAPAQADTFVRADIITDPVPTRFSVCSEHTCAKVSTVGLTPTQWDTIRGIFMPAAQQAAEERVRIARAVALLETLVGALTGTAHDKGRNFQGVGTEGQMDCIDESTNTTTYLTLMARDGLLRWHRVEDRATRGFFIFGWPHTTAVISALDDRTRYAVDAWFGDNGAAPAILPLEIWEQGWTPHG